MLVACLWGCACPMLALDPHLRLTQYIREAWTVRDGAPAGSILSIAQTPDGYLWLGTQSEGLLRFDGVKFEHMEVLDQIMGGKNQQVISLLCSSDGTLWVGTRRGLARLRQGQWKAFSPGESGTASGLHEDRNHTIWFARPWDGLYSVQNDQVSLRPLGSKPRFITSDANGTLWAGGYEGLWQLDGSHPRPYTIKDGLADSNISCLLGDREDNVWVGTQRGLTRIHQGKIAETLSKKQRMPDEEIKTILVDRHDTLWIGTARNGLCRQRGKDFEVLNQTSGLLSGRITTLFEDREGSLWIGTSCGLNRLRDGKAIPLGEPEGLGAADLLCLAKGPDGNLFVSSGFDGVRRVETAQESIRVIPGPSECKFDGPIFVASDGAIWTGHLDGLNRRKGTSTRVFKTHAQPSFITEDGQGLLFGTADGGLFHLVNGKPEPYQLGDGTRITASNSDFGYVWMLHVARDGALWIASARGACCIREGQLSRRWEKDRAVRYVAEAPDGSIWLGTPSGLLRISNQTERRFTSQEGLPNDFIQSLCFAKSGDLWCSCPQGFFQISQASLDATLLGRNQRLAVSVFDSQDGTRTSETVTASMPAVAESTDGRIWFATATGLVIFDPTRTIQNPLPPPVLIERVHANGFPQNVGNLITLPAGTQRLTIGYTGLSQLVPSKVQFKCMLEGYDAHWIDVGSRRRADYTHLPPGRYTFRVIAANNDGVWNNVGASIKIQQRPYLYQTSWFRVLAAATFLTGIYGIYRLRIRSHMLAEARLQSRIAEATARIKTLDGLLPICAWCKKIRDDSGYWNQLEEYVHEHTQAEFSHGICPECQTKLRHNASQSSKSDSDPKDSAQPQA